MSILEHIKAEADKQTKLAYNPVVAMDCIAAEGRAKLCNEIAETLIGLDEEASLAELKRLRDVFHGRSGDLSSTIKFVFSLSHSNWFDSVVDAVAKENTGWIEVRDHGFDGSLNQMLHLPYYRRMLGINNCATTITRLRGETDAAWLERRQKWLGRYHPDVRVIHSNERWTPEGMVKVDLGTVETFAQQEHLVEAGMIAFRGFNAKDAHFEIQEVYLGYKDGALGKVRQTSGNPWEPGVHTIAGYPVELVA